MISFVFLESSGTFSLWDGLKKCGVVSLELEWDSCAPLSWVSSVGLLPCSGSLPCIHGTLNKCVSNSFYVAYYLLIVVLEFMVEIFSKLDIFNISLYRISFVFIILYYVLIVVAINSILSNKYKKIILLLMV